MPKQIFAWLGLLLLLFSSCIGKKAITKKESYWDMQTIDANGGNVGRLIACRINRQGHPHAAYLKGVGLNTGRFDGQNWKIEETPLGLSLSEQSLDMELDNAGNLHLLYPSPNGLQYVYQVGADGWAAGFITERVGSGPIWDLDLKNGQEPFFVFEDKTGRLILFERYLNLWREKEILKDLKSIEDESLCISLKVDRSGPSVALAQSKKDGSSQLLVSLQGKSERVFHWADKRVSHCQLLWGRSGILHGIFLVGPLGSQNGDSMNLIYGTFVGGAWNEQLLSRDVHFIGEANPLALALDKEGKPHLVYHDLSRGGLIYLYRKTDRFWPQAPIIALGRFLGGLALAVDPTGSLWIFFRDEVSQEFKVARPIIVP